MPAKQRMSSPHVPEPPPQTWSNCLVVGHQVFTACMTARTGTAKARIGNDHDGACPAWGHKVLQQLSEQDVLMPFHLRINRYQSNRDTKAFPAGNHQHHLKAKGRWIMLAVARRVSQGMFPPTLIFHRAIPDQIQDPVRRGWKRPQRCRRHLRHDRCGIPLARPDHTPGRPIGELRRQRGPKPPEYPGAFLFSGILR